MSGIRGLNHAVLYVTDAQQSAAFYRDVLGFSIGATSKSQGAGLYHLAWQVDTIDELATIRTKLATARALKGESDHGVSKSLYGHDPDTIEFEIMWMVPESHWGTYATNAIVASLDIAAEVARWSGVVTTN